jgi:glycosyltransferase involved in cell wall biosynthesis
MDACVKHAGSWMAFGTLKEVPRPAEGLLRHLPPAPPGRTGWPWTEQTPPEQARPLDITVVVPTFNQAGTLEETLRSVLLQNNPGLRLVVMDGGSSDGAAEVLKRYSPWLSAWQSEKDKGQSAAINAGLKVADTPWCTWLNGDDLYQPGALAAAAAVANAAAETDVLLVGACAIGPSFENADVHEVQSTEYAYLLRIWNWDFIPQPSSIFRTAAFWNLGGLNEALHYCMDLDLWLRLLRVGTARKIPFTLAFFRLVPGTKTTEFHVEMIEESLAVSRCYWGHAFRRAEYAEVRRERDEAVARMYLIRAAHDQGPRSVRARQWVREVARAPAILKSTVAYSAAARILRPY